MARTRASVHNLEGSTPRMAMDIGTLVGYLEFDTSRAEKAIQGFGKAVPGWMVAGLATAGVAAAAAFGAAFMNAVDIEAGNQKVAAQLGLTEEESRRAGDAAAGAYKAGFGESMAGVQETTAGVISSIRGMREASVDELEGIVSGVQLLSDTFGVEADRISQVVGQMLSTGLASSAEEGLDLLTASLQRVPAAVREDVMDAVDEYGPFFAQIGLSGEEAMGALVAASEKGTYGIDKTGDAIKELSIRSTDMSTSSVAAYESMGLNAEEMAAKILAGGETGKEGFQQIVDGLLGIQDPVAQSQAALALFGTPLEDLGTNEIPGFLQGLSDMEGGLGEVDGAMQAASDTAGNSVAAKWEQVSRTFQDTATTVMSGLLPALMPLMDWMVQNPAIIEAVVTVLGVLAVGLGIATVAVWAMNSALLANPITWIILAIVALIAALVILVMNWDQVVAWVSEVWGGFMIWLQGVTDGFVGWWNGVWSGFASWITSVWQGFIGWIEGVWSGFIGMLQSTGDGIASWWNGLWAGIGAWIQSVWSGFVGWVQGIASGLVSFLVGAFAGYVGFWMGVWTAVSDGVRSAWEGIVGFFSGIPGRIMGFFSGIGTWLVGAGRDLIQGFVDGISGMIGAVGDAIGGVMDFVGGFFPHSPAKWGPFSGSGWTQLLDSGGAIMDQFTDGMLAQNPFSDARIEAALGGDWGSDAPAPVEPAMRGGEVHYHAAENQSLSAEEALFDAMGSPRSPFGGK